MLGLRNRIVFLVLFSCAGKGFAQNKFDHFLAPSDSLDIQRRNTVVISESVLAGSALIGLNQLWYADYAKSDFHFINDNNEWLQMDKSGHVFSSYHLGRCGYELLDWSGVGEKQKLIYGAGLGFAFLTVVEVFDGYSAEWGASTGDLIANATGTGLFVSQQLLWKEQRIVPKFSFHQTHYAALRPDVLGSTRNEEILKDYNGQTYWLSANVHSFFKTSNMPKWLNVAVGYGAEGMINGNNDKNAAGITPEIIRFRQYYFSFDVDLSRIETKSHVLKTLFSVFNTVKIPTPTFEITSHGKGKLKAFYF
jgi:hypothetical protein